MADHQSIDYWLESINLPQHVAHFVKNGFTSIHQCQTLDDDDLIQLGINLPGHRRRILSHLPTVENDKWIQNETSLPGADYKNLLDVQPDLPPKTRSPRDSYLFQDLTPAQLGIDKDEEAKPDKDNVGKDCYENITSEGVSKETPKPAPRPIPRPRRLKSKESPSTDEQKLQPAKRPTPAPRLSASPRVKKTTENDDIPVAGTTDTGHITKSAVSIKLVGACVEETSTDSSDTSALYSFPVKDKSPSPKCSNHISQDKNQIGDRAPSPKSLSGGLPRANNINNKPQSPLYDNTAEFPAVSAEEEEESGYYVNIETDIMPASNQASHQSENKVNIRHEPSESEGYMNVNIDPMSNSHGVKNYKPEAEPDDNSFDQELYSAGSFAERTMLPDTRTFEIKESRATSTPPACVPHNEQEELYEPIWDNKKNNSAESKTGVRSSCLIQFTPLPKNTAFEFKVKDKTSPVSVPQHNRASSIQSMSNRDSASFDLPPPVFAPPPLPSNASSSNSDVIADFDTLSSTALPESPLMPPIPPRPANYTRPAFKTYENVQFPLSSASTTLPDHQNMEPEYTPEHIGFPTAHDSMTVDPFQTVDPFAEFEPDSAHFETDTNSFRSSPPATSDNTSNEYSVIGTESEAIYQEADEPDDFDPFGLNQKKKSIAPNLPQRSISNSSSTSGGSHRLSEVPPPPKWYESEQPGVNMTMYSLAGHIEDDSNSDASVDILDGDSVDLDIDLSGSMTPVKVDILPSTALSPRRRERSGYLYKQGGVKQNRGWQKRWVIFDGKTLRYYSNAKDQVSKRIVPLSCMINVGIDVKANNSRQFKFKLHCTNRVFLFATDSLDDCKMWSSTLMEAIITYTKPEGGEVEGGDMANPDIADWLKIGKNRYKFYVALKKHKLCYYQNNDDYKMASPLHEIDMKLSAVKEVDRTKLQLATHYSTFLIHFESSSDAANWKMAIEEAITDALGDNTILDQVKDKAANAKCADCNAKDAHWASMNMGIVLCLRCAGIHRGFDHRISKVRSLRMDTKVWNSTLLEMFKEIGNDNANEFWLKHQPRVTICETTPSEERKLHINKKYKDKLYCDKHPLADNQGKLNEALLAAAQTDNVQLTMQILFSGADVLYSKPGSPDLTAFEIAKAAHKRIQMEFLLQNGGDKTKNFSPGSEEASLVAKLRAEVQKHGYLHKTGADMKAFLKRWCILEHGHLSYYLGEDSKVEKDRIDNESMLCIQATSHDKNPFCFEISSKKGNRIFLFSAADHKERLAWLRATAQVFCPVNLMDQVKQKDFSLAGYAYMKAGFNMEWQRTWYMLESRRLYFTDKGQELERNEDSIDLRKVTSISKITQIISESICEACLEQGPQLVLSAPDSALYFQADLAKDTERMFSALEIAVKKGGDILEDQVLNHTDDVPVIVTRCINFIQQNGVKMKGLYREAAQESKIKTLLNRFHEDARAVVLQTEEHSVHEVCNVFKRFLRNLSDPLLTAHLYRRWIQTAGESDHNTKLQWYKYLLQQLPRINYLTLRCLANHLYNLSKHSAENLMTLDNISIAFGSTLMKSSKAEQGTTQDAIGSSMQLEMKVISDIVTYYEWLFDVKEIEAKQSTIEQQIKEAESRIQQITSDPRKSIAPVNELIIWVYFLDPKGKAESVKITKNTTVSEVIGSLISKMKLVSPASWSLHEVVKSEIERPLHASTKLWPLIHEWQNWSDEYCSSTVLCLKSNELREKIEKSYDPSKPLFAEMKYCDKKKPVKMAFEFTQAKLSYYKDTKSVSNPAGSWNVEDLSIYKGFDSKRSSPTKWAFSFLSKGDKVGQKDLPYFGRAVYCNSENDLLCWLAAMIMAQHPTGFS